MKNFNQGALTELKKSFEESELYTIKLLLEDKLKSNAVKKIHLETFGKIIHHLSKELNWNEDEEIIEQESESTRVK